MRERTMIRNLVINTLWMGLLVTGPLWAQSDTQGTTTVATPLEERMKLNVSVNFDQAAIADVIKALSEQGDIDMIIAPNVTGEVTAKFTDVSLDDALENILAVHGYGYVATDSIVRILSLQELELQEIKLINKIYVIAYANIEQVANAVQGMLSERGQLAINKASNHLMVTDVDTRVALIDTFIEQADTEVPQIIVEARVYDVSCEDDLDLGFDWVAGTFTTFNTTTGAATSGQLDPFYRSSFNSKFNQATSGDAIFRFGLLDNDIDIDVSLKAMRDKIKSRLLASPKIMVLDNEEAKIKIVKEIPYQELTQTAGGGNIGTTKFKDVGVELIVTPRVTRGGKVRLDLNPIFSVQTGSVAVAVPGTDAQSLQPIVDKREAKTQALIGSGETVVIGGLRKNEVVQELSKVPGLGDLPLLGELFKHRSEKSVNSELIVFITPTIVTDAALTSDETEALADSETHLCRPPAADPIYTCECGKEHK